MPIPGSKHNDVFGDLPPSLPEDVWLPNSTRVQCNRCPFAYRSLDPKVAGAALAHHHRHKHPLHPETGELERLAESAKYFR